MHTGSSRILLSSVKNANKALVTPLPTKRSSLPVRGYNRGAAGGEASSSGTTGEPVTHTGHVFDPNDPRRARFVGRQKELNAKFAIDLVAEEPVCFVGSARVACCDGGGGALGHPKVYINLDNSQVGTCGYCGLRFKQGRSPEEKVLMPHQDDLQAERSSTFGALKGMATRVLHRLFSAVKDGVSLFYKMFVRVKRKTIQHKDNKE